MKNIILISLLFAYSAFARFSLEEQKVKLINDFLAPFLETMETFSNNNRSYAMTKAEFKQNVQQVNEWLKQNKRNWQPLLDLDKDLSSLTMARRQLEKKSSVAKVFTTKPGTLVFILKSFPNVLIKIDNRNQSFIAPGDRTYFQAQQITQDVQQQTIFSSLYLPLEEAIQTDYQQATIIFSERIPLFSEQEIDQRILLNMMIKTSKDSPQLKNNLKKMYKQMIHYICRINFDDITYTNLPFTKSGQLAPFDTDSQSAKTGVINFLRHFFGYKILSIGEVRTALETSCQAPNIPNPERLESLYDDHSAEDEFYNNNKKFIEEALNFLADKQANFRDQFDMSTLIHDEPNRKYVKIIDTLFNEKKAISSSKATIFGRHCVHISDISYEAAERISSKYQRISIAEAMVIVRQILNRVRDFGNLYSAEPIDHSLGNKRDLRSFVCF